MIYDKRIKRNKKWIKKESEKLKQGEKYENKDKRDIYLNHDLV